MIAAPVTDITYYAGVTDDEFAEWRATAERVAAELAETAIERVRANQKPVAELQLLREAGILGFAAPRELGGGGGNLSQALKLSRIIRGRWLARPAADLPLLQRRLDACPRHDGSA
jgi:alkylation response protein AidB-like acyl-CoA dehydrogenase